MEFHDIYVIAIHVCAHIRMCAGADPGMKKKGALLLAGDSVHSAPSMGSGSMSPKKMLAL